MESAGTDPLFDDQGNLRRELFAPEAQKVLGRIREWLDEVERRMFLPLDLLIVLLEHGHADLSCLVADGTDGVVNDADVLPRLQLLSLIHI